ncbi:MAG: YggT family protein [Chloroflexi bacterium]|nr:MAG: YggT family protein [Chloroflexota bacterium]TMD78870.1 MAG: YggT family protein [Chloroflexota bacterium]TMF01921.1 MAG: YggT family protein [Chloroflexota bacterium]TMG26461.1 MAG: YggT family protein [Chloroflexota bacterium]
MPLITTVLTIALYALLILVFVRAALSWFSPHPTSEWQRLVFRATEPMLAPVRRWVPPVSGLDLSPLVVTMAIIFVIAAIRSIG